MLPMAVNEIKQIGLESLAAAFAYGAAGIGILARRAPRNGIATLAGTVDLAGAFAAALGYGEDSCRILHADTPDEMLAELAALPLGRAAPAPASFAPAGSKRELLELSLRMLHRVRRHRSSRWRCRRARPLARFMCRPMAARCVTPA